jgi:hypothetical protein
MASLLLASCGRNRSDFELFMEVPLPASVTVVKMDGNWGNDPWRCWELSPVDQRLKDQLIARWSLTPDPKAFRGVASGGGIYCRFKELDESYSHSSSSYRAVGIKGRRMLIYFYNG